MKEYLIIIVIFVGIIMIGWLGLWEITNQPVTTEIYEGKIAMVGNKLCLENGESFELGNTVNIDMAKEYKVTIDWYHGKGIGGNYKTWEIRFIELLDK